MSAGEPTSLDWIVLTTGGRPDELSSAVASVEGGGVLVVSNGAGHIVCDPARVVVAEENLGVPGGRHLGAQVSSAPILGFLDDDAVLSPGATRQIVDSFDHDDDLGAVAVRLVDEDGATSRRHVPRLGAQRPGESGEVALFLGGACAIRAAAYHDVGGYFVDLFYGHEEVELCWRLVDHGWKIRYLADVTAYHPKTEISRHPDGWWRTGRNRVWIARRTLPWPVALVHVLIWLAVGSVRAPAGGSRRAYVAGWRRGWSGRIDRRPIRWSTVWKLVLLRRPPLV